MAMPNMPKEAWAELDKFPLSQPPLNVTPDFEHPEWHGQPVVISGAVGVAVMLIMAFIRIYIKCYVPKRWTIDDTIFALSLSGGISYIALQIALVTGGAYGYHAWEVKVGDLTKPVLLRSLVLQVFVPLLIWTIKLAVYSLIYYAFNPLKYIRRMVYVGVVLSFFYYLAVSILSGIICGPKGGTDRLSYMAGMAGQQCGDPAGLIQIFSITSGVVNLLNDLYLFILPLPAIMSLRLPPKKKFGILMIFLAGLGACGMSALGLVYRRRGYSRNATNMWARDTTYLNLNMFIVATVEYSVGVIIPCMAPLVRFSSYLSGNVRTYFSTRSFHRTSSIEGSYAIGNKGEKQHVQGKFESQTNTIDRMLAQMFPGESGREMSKTTTTREG